MDMRPVLINSGIARKTHPRLRRYVDEDLRLARGNKGTVFVLRRDSDVSLPTD